MYANWTRGACVRSEPHKFHFDFARVLRCAGVIFMFFPRNELNEPSWIGSLRLEPFLRNHLNISASTYALTQKHRTLFLAHAVYLKFLFEFIYTGWRGDSLFKIIIRCSKIRRAARFPSKKKLFEWIRNSILKLQFPFSSCGAWNSERKSLLRWKMYSLCVSLQHSIHTFVHVFAWVAGISEGREFKDIRFSIDVHIQVLRTPACHTRKC